MEYIHQLKELNEQKTKIEALCTESEVSNREGVLFSILFSGTIVNSCIHFQIHKLKTEYEEKIGILEKKLTLSLEGHASVVNYIFCYQYQ